MEKQIEKCLKLSSELRNEFLKIPMENPLDQDEFCLAINSMQEKLAMKIARIYRPDIFFHCKTEFVVPSVAQVIEDLINAEVKSHNKLNTGGVKWL